MGDDSMMGKDWHRENGMGTIITDKDGLSRVFLGTKAEPS